MTVNLDNTTPINFINLRQGNAFGFQFDIGVNDSPINASAYNIELRILRDTNEVLVIANDDWTKSGSVISKLYNAFPLPVGFYTFHCTFTNPSGQVVTIVPGSITIIRKDYNGR